jgi:AraC-like DNA-binding protein
MSKNRNNPKDKNLSVFQNTESDNDIKVELFDNLLPFTNGISRIKDAIVFVCLEGVVNLEINMTKYTIIKNTCLLLFPSQIVDLKTVSDNLKTMYFIISSDVLNEALFRFPAEFLTFMKDNTIYQGADEYIANEKRKFEMLKGKCDDKNNICRREILLNLIRVFYLEFYNDIHTELERNSKKNNRKREIFEQFTKLVMKNYEDSREVLFYANELRISAKYLSMILQELDGRNAKKWIDDYVASEIKIRLQSSNESIENIAYDLNFADQSFLCKYFKRQTGISPSEYRRNVIE